MLFMDAVLLLFMVAVLLFMGAVLLFMEAVLRHGQSSIDNAAVYGGIAGMNGCDADMCMLTVLPFMKTPT